jgi:hypothetical protein
VYLDGLREGSVKSYLKYTISFWVHAFLMAGSMASAAKKKGLPADTLAGTGGVKGSHAVAG